MFGEDCCCAGGDGKNLLACSWHAYLFLYIKYPQIGQIVGNERFYRVDQFLHSFVYCFQSTLHWIRHRFSFGPRNLKLENSVCILCFINNFFISVVVTFKKAMTVHCIKRINQECIINYDNTVTNINCY